MKSFDSVYNNERSAAETSRRSKIDAEHASLVEAMKKEYGINDFTSLSEKKKAAFKSLINEMWDVNGGLNEKGRLFLQESVKPLTKESDSNEIKNYIRRNILPNAEKILKNIVDGKRDEILENTKKEIEEKTGRKISKRDYISMAVDYIFPVIVKKIKTTMNL